MIIMPPGEKMQLNQLALAPFYNEIVQKKERSPLPYVYGSLEDLLFELSLRRGTVETAKALQFSGVKFATYRKSHCNERFWSRTDKGGFQLRYGVMPSDGIQDIYQNGPLYGFECSMAIMIVMYKAVLDQIGPHAFNTYFNDLLLYDWHYDSDLGFTQTNWLIEASPGDILYFKNPDHNPETPEWQGENVIKLEDDLYYGHGIGIKSSASIIAALNSRRRPGSTVSAYLMNQVIHPNYEHLRGLAGVFARIGGQVYKRPRKIV